MADSRPGRCTFLHPFLATLLVLQLLDHNLTLLLKKNPILATLRGHSASFPQATVPVLTFTQILQLLLSQRQFLDMNFPLLYTLNKMTQWGNFSRGSVTWINDGKLRKIDL